MIAKDTRNTIISKPGVLVADTESLSSIINLKLVESLLFAFIFARMNKQPIFKDKHTIVCFQNKE